MTDLDVVGIGNALVDVLSTPTRRSCREGLIKGAMALVDESGPRALRGDGSGGRSLGRLGRQTIVGVASLGGRRAATSARCATTVGEVFRHDFARWAWGSRHAAASNGPAHRALPDRGDPRCPAHADYLSWAPSPSSARRRRHGLIERCRILYLGANCSIRRAAAGLPHGRRDRARGRAAGRARRVRTSGSSASARRSAGRSAKWNPVRQRGEAAQLARTRTSRPRGAPGARPLRHRRASSAASTARCRWRVTSVLRDRGLSAGGRRSIRPGAGDLFAAASWCGLSRGADMPTGGRLGSPGVDGRGFSLTVGARPADAPAQAARGGCLPERWPAHDRGEVRPGWSGCCVRWAAWWSRSPAAWIRPAGPRRRRRARRARTARDRRTPRPIRSRAGRGAALGALIGLRHVVVRTEELANPEYARNGANRCFFCKDELFGRLAPIAAREGLARARLRRQRWTTSATTARDEGRRRARRAAPLIEAELYEGRDPRSLTRAGPAHVGQALVRLPVFPLPVRRSDHGREAAQVDAAETFVRSLGFRQFRVRHHDRLARLEIPWRRCHACGRGPPRGDRDAVARARLLYVAVDLAGFQSGSANLLLGLKRRANG